MIRSLAEGAVMDWSGWKTALELWLKTPELIAATILLLLLVGGSAARLAWKARDHTAAQREANLINTATQREANLQNSITDLRRGYMTAVRTSGMRRESCETRYVRPRMSSNASHRSLTN
jgi:hypothetical protein